MFVYGTLRKGEFNHGVLAGATVVAMQAWTKGRLVDTGQGYPALVPDDVKTTYGEVYRVSAARLPDIDRLEGYLGEGKDNLFERKTLKVITDSGSVDALVYTFSPERADGMRPVEHGDWRVARLLANPEVWLFLAYGSVMDDRRLVEHGVDDLFLDVIGRGELDGYTLTFTHFNSDGSRADVMELGGRVEGKVFRIEEEALTYLLMREGVHSNRYRAAFMDVTVDGTLHQDVLIFVSVQRTVECSPPDWYADEILRGGSYLLTGPYLAQVGEKLAELAAKRDGTSGSDSSPADSGTPTNG